MSGRDRRPTLLRLAEARGLSPEAQIAEAVIDAQRWQGQAAAADLGLLRLGEEGWRRAWARAELIGALVAARGAGLSWPEVTRLARACVAEVRGDELRRGHI